MEKYFEAIRKCSLFDGIGDEQMMKMLHCLGARVEFFDKKYTVFAEGGPAKYIGIVLSGSVQIVQVDYYGNRNIVSVAEKYELFGEAFACAEMGRMPVSVVAAEPSQVILIDCGHILHTCSNNCGFHQQLIMNLMKSLANKNIMFHQRIEITSKRTTREKLMAYLMLQAKRANSNYFTIPYDRQELADYLEVDRSGLSNEISKLRNEGVLDSHRKHFKLM